MNRASGKAGKDAGKGIQLRVPALLRFSSLPILLSGLWLPASHSKADLIIGAAISLSDAVTEISAAYEKGTGVKVTHTFAATNVIARQIEAGAPIDVFLSADTAHTNALSAKGLIEKGSARIIATNELVVIVPADAKRAPKSPRDLLALDRIAIADPTSVPAGIYARKWLMGEGVWEKIQPRTIPFLSVRAALIAVETGNAPAAITYRSDAAAGRKVRIAFAADPTKTGPIAYPAAIVRTSAHKAEAQAYIAFLASEEAGEAFIRHGFTLPQAAP